MKVEVDEDLNVEFKWKADDDDLFVSDIGEDAETEADEKVEIEKLYVERDDIVVMIETDNEESLGVDEDHLVEIGANIEDERDMKKMKQLISSYCL